MPLEETTPRPRLDSWKSIAQHLGRSVRTVQRWETEEALPVHRLAHEQRGSVYAFVDELDAWWQSRSVQLTPTGAPETASRPVFPPAKWRKTLWASGVVVTLLLAGTFAVRTAGSREAAYSPPSPVPLTSFPQSESFPSFSPDGKSFAFDWNSIPGNIDIFVKSVKGGEPKRLTTHPLADYNAAWSPDGRQIAFLRALTSDRAELILLPAEGGMERSLGQFEGVAQNNLKVPPGHIGWTPDSRFLLIGAQEQPGQPISLWRVTVADGARAPILPPDLKTLGDAGPAVSPDGKRLAFHRFIGMGRGDIHVAPLDAQSLARGPSIPLTKEKYNANPVWINNHELLYHGYRQGEMQMFRISADAAGPPLPVMGGTVGAQIAYSVATAQLAFTQGKISDSLLRVALRAPGSAEGLAKELIRSSRQDVAPAYSPNGGHIAFTSNRAGYPNIWICDREGAQCRQLSFLEGSITGPVAWSPEGSKLVFASNTTGAGDIYTLAIGDTGGTPKNLTSDAPDDIRPAWSRDGKWIYFGSNRSGRYEVWKTSPDGGAPVQVTNAGGSSPMESVDGHWLYYSADNQYDTSLWRKPVAGGDAEKVVDGMHYWYSVGRTGVYYASVRRRELRYWNATKREDRFFFEMPSFLALGLSVSPDERELCMSAAQRSGTDIMMIAPYR